MSLRAELYSERMRVRVHEIDASQRAPAQAVCNLFQEAAGAHCLSLGIAVAQVVAAHGETWMLHRLAVRLYEPPRWRDEVTVETWPCGVERIYAVRDFRMLAEDGRVLAEASTSWLVVDVEARRILRSPKTPFDWSAGRERALPDAFRGRVPVLELPSARREFEVRRSDIDANGHVNHVHFVTWALDALPAHRWEGSRVASVDVEYLAEALEGEAVSSECAPEGDGGTWLHRLVRPADGKLLARMRSGWAKE